VAEYLGLDPKPIRAIAGKYQAKPVDPSDLPNDEQILEIWEGIGPYWQWVYGMMATYGLRPHECFHVDTELRQGTLIAKVSKNTKTGARIVLPLPGEWCDRFGLANKRMPNVITEEKDNRRLSGRISLRFRQKQIPHTPKALRHAYSCRGARYGIQPDVMARMMGHSISVHCKTYQSAISLTQYQEVFKKAEGHLPTHTS
jgi:integrase